MKKSFEETGDAVLRALSAWRKSEPRDYSAFNAVREEAIVSCGWTLEEFNTECEKALAAAREKIRMGGF